MGEANREEAAIARTPKASEGTRTAKARPAATKAAAKPAPKAKAAPPRAKAAAAKPKATGAKARPAVAKAKPAPARTKAAAPKAPRAAAKAPARSARTAAPKATPQLKASAAAAGKRAAEGPPRPARAPQARKPKVAPALLDRLVVAAQKSLEDDKAEDIIVLDVTGRADYADRLVIATGLADRQIQAMASHLEEAFEKEGLRLRRDATSASPDWVLIDAGDLVVHLFKPEARGRYALERMWGPESPAPDRPQDRTPLPDDGAGGSTATEEDED